MKKLIPLLLLFLSCKPGKHTKSFEGKVIYNNIYKSNSAAFTDKQLIEIMGPKQEYYIKDGNYKSVLNGSGIEWQLYINRENKIYTKIKGSSEILKNDAVENTDEVLKTEFNKQVTQVLGYTCDEVILTCKSGLQKYYFNSQLPVDPSLFKKHKLGNWNVYVSLAKALPLKMIIDTKDFRFESTATEIKEQKLESSFFELKNDPGIKIIP